MADSKISALPASTTPLAGTEVLPIVQSGATKQVSVANLTAGRALSATELTLTTGNLIVSSGKGVDFSATPGTGTSELLADYEEGKFTVAITCGTSGTVTLEPTQNEGFYTKVGRVVNVQASVRVASVSSPVGFFGISLPYAISTAEATTVSFSAPLGVSFSASSTVGAFIGAGIDGESRLRVFLNTGNQLVSTSANQLQASSDIWFTFSYVTA